MRSDSADGGAPRTATVLISIGAATYLGGMILDITGASGLHPGLELRAAF